MPLPDSAAVHAPRIAPLRPMLGFLALALLALAVGASNHPVVYGTLVLFICVVAVPAWLQWQRGQLDAFESIHVIGLINLVYFGFGAVWTVRNPEVVAFDLYTVPYVPRAAFYCLLGQIAMLAAYFGPWYQERKRGRFEEWPRGLGFLVAASAVGLVGSVARSIWNFAHWADLRVSTLVSSVSQLATIYYVAWGMGWVMVFSGRASRAQRRFVVWVLSPLTVLIVLSAMTDKSLALTLAGIPLISYWYAKRRLPWRRLLLLLLALVFIVFPFINTFRVLDVRIPFGSRVATTTEVIAGWSTEEYLDHSVRAAQGRLALINSVAVVVRDVPRWVPYAQGATIFLPTLQFFVPRVIWPDKPVFSMGREFGETFRMVTILDEKTNVSTTVPGELYWNFDLPGILIGMAVWGWVLRLAYRRYGEGRVADPVRRAIHILLLVQFVHFGAGIAGQSTNLLRMVLVIEGFRWLAHRFDLLTWVPIPDPAPGSARPSPPARP